MKAITKWGRDSAGACRTIQCPSCKSIRVNRKKKRCYSCGIALYAGSDLLLDVSGWWWHPEKNRWIQVQEIYDQKMLK